MEFYDVLDQVVALLQQRKRVTYGALTLQFKLDDEHLKVLKEELIEAQEVAVDKDGKMLVWIGGEATPVLIPTRSCKGIPPLRRDWSEC